MLRFLKRAAADVPTPAVDKVTLFVGTDGDLYLKDETGTAAGVGGGGGATILQQDAEPASPAAGDLWIDTDETASGSGTTVWQDWTPTLANLTLGNGTVVARYAQDGDLVHWFFKMVLGSTSAVGTNPSFTLPVAAHANYDANTHMGQGLLTDAGTANHPAVGNYTGSAVQIRSSLASTTSVTATAPFTWTTSDRISFSGTYEAA